MRRVTDNKFRSIQTPAGEITYRKGEVIPDEHEQYLSAKQQRLTESLTKTEQKEITAAAEPAEETPRRSRSTT